MAWIVRSSPGQTFVLYPAAVIAVESIRRGGKMDARFAPLLLWGFLQYRLCRAYRQARAGGGPGMERPPERLVTSGPYALSRNPMYLGHIVFTLGLALVFRSPLAAALLVERGLRFSRRVRADEARLEKLFGEEYRVYRRRVSRWVPAITAGRSTSGSSS